MTAYYILLIKCFKTKISLKDFKYSCTQIKIDLGTFCITDVQLTIQHLSTQSNYPLWNYRFLGHYKQLIDVAIFCSNVHTV